MMLIGSLIMVFDQSQSVCRCLSPMANLGKHLVDLEGLLNLLVDLEGLLNLMVDLGLGCNLLADLGLIRNLLVDLVDRVQHIEEQG